jgi:hypothetical protein
MAPICVFRPTSTLRSSRSTVSWRIELIHLLHQCQQACMSGARKALGERLLPETLHIRCRAHSLGVSRRPTSIATAPCRNARRSLRETLRYNGTPGSNSSCRHLAAYAGCDSRDPGAPRSARREARQAKRPSRQPAPRPSTSRQQRLPNTWTRTPRARVVNRLAEAGLVERRPGPDGRTIGVAHATRPCRRPPDTRRPARGDRSDADRTHRTTTRPAGRNV